MRPLICSRYCLALTVWLGSVAAASAQRPGSSADARRPQPGNSAVSSGKSPALAAAGSAPDSSTTLQIDLTTSDASQVLHSQNWGRVFDQLGRRVRIKTAGGEEDLSIRETVRGSLRTVLIAGRIDRRGALVFKGRTFQPGEERALRDWLDELETYGAQGNPAGQPRWGLTSEQFQSLFESLAADVSIELEGQPLVDAVRTLGFGTDIPIRVSEAAAGKWASGQNPLIVRQDVRGLTRGSALALLLNDHGLCFRPLRTPGGAIDLVILDRAATPDPWPIGWEPRPDVPRSDYAPGLFAFDLIGFLDRPVTETLAEARKRAGCPIVIDLPGVARKDIDLSQRTFGLSQKKTAWILVLQPALGGTGLVPQIRVDEAGRGFVLIGPFESRSIRKP